jgi:hypothetical protein
MPTKIADVILALLRPSQLLTLAPLIPGGVLVLGGLVVFHSRITLTAVPPAFGGATVMVLAIFAAYVSGLILVDLTIACSSLIGFGLGSVFGNRLTGQKDLPVEPWKNSTWRAVTREYIGEKLTPPIERALSEENFAALLTAAEGISNAAEKSKFIWEKTSEQGERALADFRWNDLYTALDSIFPRPLQRIEAGSSTVLSTALAAIIILSYSPVLRASLIALCVATMIIGFVYQLNIARTYVASDRNGAHQIGMMIREMQTRMQVSQPGEQPKEQHAAAGHPKSTDPTQG